MLLLNFGPQLTAAQLAEIGGILGEAPTVQHISPAAAPTDSLVQRAHALVEAAGLTSLE